MNFPLSYFKNPSEIPWGAVARDTKGRALRIGDRIRHIDDREGTVERIYGYRVAIRLPGQSRLLWCTPDREATLCAEAMVSK